MKDKIHIMLSLAPLQCTAWPKKVLQDTQNDYGA